MFCISAAAGLVCLAGHQDYSNRISSSNSNSALRICLSTQDNILVFKYADNTAIQRLITGEDEAGYRGLVESILTPGITVWYGNTTQTERKALQRVVRTAERIMTLLPQNIYIQNNALKKTP